MPAHVRCSLAICLLSLSALVSGVPAAAAEWTPAGPHGGSVRSLAFQPGSSHILYAGTEGGVFKSLDGGATWLPPGKGLVPSAIISDIAIDPTHPTTLYAGADFQGAYKSTDGGAHWTSVGPGPAVFALATAPGGVVYAGTSTGLFRSSDGGATWQARNQGLPQTSTVYSLEIDPSQPDRIYAGLLNKGFYRSTDGGTHWSQPGGAASLAGGVYGLAVSTASPATVYAVTSDGIARSFDSGSTWLLPESELAQPVSALAAHPTLPDTVYAGTWEGAFRSDDRGATWVPASQGLHDVNIKALAIDPATPSTLFAGTANFSRLGGVFKTTDAGEHWTFSSHGLSAVNVFNLTADPRTPGTLFAAIGYQGLLRSRDRGLHWTRLPVPDGAPISDVEVDPVDPSTVYATVSANGPLLKSTDGGDTWTRLGTSPNGLLELEIDPVHPTVFHAGGTGFYKSTDAGATWVRSPSFELYTPWQIEITPGVLYAIAFLPPQGDGVPAGTPGTQMFRSTDGGETWEALNAVPNPKRLAAVSPSDPKTVYVIADIDTIFRTTDGGDTWHSVSQLPGAASLAMAPGVPETLYAAVSNQGVLASTDGGVTWTPVGQGLEGLSFGKLVLDPRDPARLYLTVHNRGIATVRDAECHPGPTTLCLQGGRFQVEATWKDFAGNTGFGQAIPMTNETGGLWFFDAGNVELVAKVLDGRGINGRFWVFVASLTSVECTLTVTDTETGAKWVYRNPSGHMASFGDTEAF